MKDLFKLTDDSYDMNFYEDLSDYTKSKVKYEIKGKDYVDEQFLYYYEDILTYPNDYADLPTDYSISDVIELALSLAKANASMTIKVRNDGDNSLYEYYKKYFKDLNWYECRTDEDSSVKFEDENGKIAVTLININDIQTTIIFKIGSGEHHSPEFSFDSSSYEIAIGTSKKKLGFNQSMLNGTRKFTSDNEHITINDAGFVNVSSDATDGETATITAILYDDNNNATNIATCKVTAYKNYEYTVETAMQAVLTKLQASYPNASISSDNSIELKLTASEAFTIDSIKNYVSSDIIPEGFTTDSYDDWSNTDIMNSNGDYIGYGTRCTYSCLKNSDPDLKINFSVYNPYKTVGDDSTKDENSIVLLITAEGNSDDYDPDELDF